MTTIIRRANNNDINKLQEITVPVSVWAHKPVKVGDEWIATRGQYLGDIDVTLVRSMMVNGKVMKDLSVETMKKMANALMGVIVEIPKEGNWVNFHLVTAQVQVNAAGELEMVPGLTIQGAGRYFAPTQENPNSSVSLVAQTRMTKGEDGTRTIAKDDKGYAIKDRVMLVPDAEDNQFSFDCMLKVIFEQAMRHAKGALQATKRRASRKGSGSASAAYTEG